MDIRSYAAAAALWTVAVLGVHADAAFHSCGACSTCCHEVQKVCRVVCEMKEVKETKYKCVCEDFCIPGRSHKVGCQEVPTCGEVKTRKKLVKYEEVTKVPHYKCVVKYLCPTCCRSHGFAALPQGVNLVDGQDAPAAIVPTLAEQREPAASPASASTPAEQTVVGTPAVKPVSHRRQP